MGLSLGVIRTLNLKLRLGDLRRSWRSVLILVVILVSSLQWLFAGVGPCNARPDRACRTVHHSRSTPQPTMAGLRTIADRAGIGRCSGAGPHWPASPAIAGCAQHDPLEMAHVAVVVGARSGDFERWDHCSQITSEGLDRPPACVRCPRTTSANRRNGPQSGSRDQCRPAAVAYERSNRGDEILQRQDGFGGRLRLSELPLTVSQSNLSNDQERIPASSAVSSSVNDAFSRPRTPRKPNPSD